MGTNTTAACMEIFFKDWGSGQPIVCAAAHPTYRRRSLRYLADFLRSISGPIVLVGHSCGGGVISNAATGNEQVQALVLLNGWMPKLSLCSSSGFG